MLLEAYILRDKMQMQCDVGTQIIIKENDDF